MMVMTRLGAAMPSIGQDWLLPSFLAPVLGGTLLAGGFVSIVGTSLGALLKSDDPFRPARSCRSAISGFSFSWASSCFSP